MPKWILWIVLIPTNALPSQEVDLVEAGNHALDRGQISEAIANFERALALRPQHNLRTRISLATAYIEAAEYRKAEIALREAETAESTGLERAELYNGWGSLYLVEGKLPAAENEFQRAREILDGMPKPGADLAVVLHNLAAIEMRTGRYGEAHRHSERAMALWEKTLGPDHPDLIKGWASLASLEYIMGRRADAEVALERAIHSAEKVYGPDHLMVADLLESYAVVLDGLKRKVEAKQIRKRASLIKRTAKQTEPAQLTLDVREALVTGNQVHLRTK